MIRTRERTPSQRGVRGILGEAPRWLSMAFSVVLLSANPAWLWAQDSAAAAPPSGTESRLERVEKENAELRRRIEALEREREDAPTGATSKESLDAEGVREAVTPTELRGLSVRSGPFETNFQFFGDVGFEYTNPDPEEASHASFVLGSLDGFATARIGERFQALTEAVLEGGSHQDEVGVELERLWGSWALNDLLYVKLGREHSVVSRWNRKFHHGRWLWPAATPPFLARFEEQGGILPTHLVGVELGGKAFSRFGLLEYVFAVANGRDRAPDEVQNLGDRNDAKAYAVGLSFSPHTVSPLTVGVNFYADELPHVPADPARAHAIRELNGGGFVDLASGPLAILAEISVLNHKDRVRDRHFEHATGYVQLNYRIGRVTPYVRFDRRSMDLGDVYFAPDGLDLDRWEQVLGVHYRLNDFARVSLDGGFGHAERRAASGDVAERSMSRLTLVLSWTF